MQPKYAYTLKKDGLKCEIQGEIDDAAVMQAYKKKLTEASASYSMPGFRAGKVPKSFIEKRFGHGLKSEIKYDLIQKGLDHALAEESLDPVASPQVELPDQGGQQEPGSRFVARFECYPEIDMSGLKLIEMPSWEVKYDAKDIEARKEELKGNYKDWVSREKGAKIIKGDKVKMDFSGTIDGVPFEGGSAEGYEAEVGNGYFLPEFDAALLNAHCGDEISKVAVVFPSNYQKPDLRGKQALFDIHIKEVLSPEIIQDEVKLFEKLGSKAKSWDEYVPEMQSYFSDAEKKLLESVHKVDFIQKMLKHFDVALPESLVQERLKGLEHIEEEKARLEEAQKHVKISLVFRKMLHHFEIKVSDAEIDAYIEAVFPGLKDNAQLLAWYKQDKHRLSQVQESILERKIVERAIAECKRMDTSILTLAEAKTFIDQEV